jgi:hypothetical protein
LKQREIRTLQNTAINRKSRSKKIVQLKVIDTNIYAVWYREMANKLKRKRIRSKLKNDHKIEKAAAIEEKKLQVRKSSYVIN